MPKLTWLLLLVLLSLPVLAQSAPPAPPPTNALQQELWKKLQTYIEDQDR